MRVKALVVGAALLVVPGLFALPAVAAEPAAPSASSGPPEAATCGVLPALTPVELELGAALGSATSKEGDAFPFRLKSAIRLGECVIAPAGVSGVGEVIHAKKSGGSGSPGELVLAARYLDLGGRHLRLRSMDFATAGANNFGNVNTLMVASAVTVPAVAFVGFAIKGKNVAYPAGTIAHARTAVDFLPEPAAKPSAVQPAQSNAAIPGP
jgi:hypothetical protein